MLGAGARRPFRELLTQSSVRRLQFGAALQDRDYRKARRDGSSLPAALSTMRESQRHSTLVIS
jgi:hypothetical protein